MSSLPHPTPEDERETAIRRHNEGMTRWVVGVATPVASVETRLRDAIVVAATYLRNNAPSRALETLERAMKL